MWISRAPMLFGSSTIRSSPSRVSVVASPLSASYARGFTAVLLAVGTVGLVVLNLIPSTSNEPVSQRQ